MLLPLNAHYTNISACSPFTLGCLLYPSLGTRNLESERVCQVWGSRQIIINCIPSWLLQMQNNFFSNPKLATCQPQPFSMYTQAKCSCSVSAEPEYKEIQYNNPPVLLHSSRTGSSRPMSLPLLHMDLPCTHFPLLWISCQTGCRVTQTHDYHRPDILILIRLFTVPKVNVLQSLPWDFSGIGPGPTNPVLCCTSQLIRPEQVSCICCPAQARRHSKVSACYFTWYITTLGTF